MPIIRNLVRYYVYDFSEHMGWPCSADGKFGGCDDLPRYWKHKGNAPFLIRSGRELVGFVLVDGNPKRAGIDHRIGEFFVLRKFRRRGIGQRIACEVFDRFPGRWMVEQLKENTPAVRFWRAVIRRYTRGKFRQMTVRSKWGVDNVILFENGRHRPEQAIRNRRSVPV